MANMADIAEIVAKLSAAYPNWKTTKYTVEVYYQDLKDIPSSELHVAAQHCRSEAGRQFAPSVGELRGAVMELRRTSMNVPSAYEAWQSFLRYINDGTPLHPLARKTVDSLGERNLRMSENQTADRARFIQCYEQLTERAEKEMMLIPEVRNYLENNGARLLEAPHLRQVKQLSERLKK